MTEALFIQKNKRGVKIKSFPASGKIDIFQFFYHIYPMQKPKVFDFYDYKKFLSCHLQWMKSKNASWSLGAWASKLDLAGTASISRILAGERIPSDELEQKLIKYFEFDSVEIDYFQSLLERQRRYNSFFPKVEHELLIQNARNFDLVGVLDFGKTKDFLFSRGLEPLLMQGQVIASININTYPETTFGPFNESHICIVARPLGSGLLDSGLYFGAFIYNREDIYKTSKDIWGYDCHICSIELSESQYSLQATLNQNTLFKCDLSGKVFSKIEERYEMYGYSENSNGLFKARFTIDSIGRESPFDNGKDFCFLDVHQPAFQILHSLSFTPVKWVIHENLFSRAFKKEPIKRHNSF